MERSSGRPYTLPLVQGTSFNGPERSFPFGFISFVNRFSFLSPPLRLSHGSFLTSQTSVLLVNIIRGLSVPELSVVAGRPVLSFLSHVGRPGTINTSRVPGSVRSQPHFVTKAAFISILTLPFSDSGRIACVPLKFYLSFCEVLR